MPVSEQLLDALNRLEESGVTRYRIAKDAGVTLTTVYGFMSGERPSISLDAVDALCDYLGVRLTTPRIERISGEAAGKQASKSAAKGKNKARTGKRTAASKRASGKTTPRQAPKRRSPK